MFVESLAILKIPENSLSQTPNNIDSDNDVDEELKTENLSASLPSSISQNLLGILQSLFEISSKDTSIQQILNNI